MISKILITTNPQKILRFLLLHPGKSCYEREIARGAKISFGSANYILRQFYKKGLLQRKAEGRMCYYCVNLSNPYIKEFKVLNNLLVIEPLVEKLKSCTNKIILYGSWASGIDTERSDIDLFIISSEEDKVRPIINKYSNDNEEIDRKIQAVIISPTELLATDSKEKVFRDEVEQGKVLWDKEINEDNL